MSTKRFEEVAERWLDIVSRSPSGEFMCRCPFHGEDNTPSLQFNVNKGLWVCFVCEEGGTAERMVKRLGGIYSDPAVSTEMLRASLKRLKKSLRGDDAGVPVLDEKYLLRFNFPHDYWTKERKFDGDTIRKWGLGYNPINDRCTIAYRNPHGDLLGVIERRLDDEFPRYLYPKGFDRSGSLFGSWFVSSGSRTQIAVVEGSTDAVRVDEAGPTAVAQFGSSISARQVALLRRIGVREIVLGYDYDLGGRKAELQAREALEGFILRRFLWDTDVYCWHEKLCACGQHNWMTIYKCKKRVACDCGRIHKADPGKLSNDEISDMYDQAQLIGGRKWRPGKSAR